MLLESLKRGAKTMEPKTVYEMLKRSAGFFPDKTALIFEGGRGENLSRLYRDLLKDVDMMAEALKSKGVMAGERICLYLPNSHDFIVIYFAVSKIGAVSVLLNPNLPEERVKKAMEDAGAKILIGEEKAKELWAAISFSPIWRSLPSCEAAKQEASETSVVLYSSGTTGEQKGVELTVSNLYHNIRYVNAYTGMTPDDKVICFLPLTHCFGINFILGTCFYTGATLVLHGKFDIQEVPASLVRNGVTMFFAVPAIYNMMLKQEVEQFYLSSVKYFFYAADSMSVESILAWKKEYGRRIYTGWGLTETSPDSTMNYEDIYKLGSVGRPIPGVEVKIADPDKKDGKGEMCVRGHNVMKGYLNRPEETAEAIDGDGWFYTGDTGYLDEEGYVFVVDRLKNMINVGGEKAWPAEIEKIILQHPGVADVGVIGIPNEKMGEVPKAFVVVSGHGVTRDELRKFIEPKLMKHEFPREIEFVKEIPRTPSGKILHRELREKR